MHPFHSPYRCQDCNARFWVISRRARWGATGGLIVLMIVGVVAVPMAWRHQVAPAQATPAAPGAANAVPLDDIVKAQSLSADGQVRAGRFDVPR